MIEEEMFKILADYGIGGVFIAYLIFRDITRQKRIMERIDALTSEVKLQGQEQRTQDKDQNDRLFDLLKELKK